MNVESDITDPLVAWNDGDSSAQSRLIERVYAALKRLPSRAKRKETG